MAHLWQLIESNGGKPVARGQTADYAILPMNTFADEELQAKQLVSNTHLFKRKLCNCGQSSQNVIFLFMYQLIVTCGYCTGVGAVVN